MKEPEMRSARGNLVAVSEARQRAADALAAGLRAGDRLTDEDVDDIKEYRAYLPEALAKRHLQLQEEPAGWRVVRAPFSSEVLAAVAAPRHNGAAAAVA